MSDAVIEAKREEQAAKGSEEKKEGIIIREKTPEPVKEAITKEQAVEAGWSEAEIKQAEERKMFTSKEEQDGLDAEKKKAEEAKKSEEARKAKGTTEEEEEKKKAEAGEKGKAGESTQEKRQVSRGQDFELSEADQVEFEKVFKPGSNVHGLYRGMRSQRTRAQVAERERDDLLIKNKMLEKNQAGLNDRLTKLELPGAEGEEEGDPEDKPLTMRALKNLEKERDLKRKENKAVSDQQTDSLSEAMKEQEEFAKSEYPNYTEVVALGEDVVKGKVKLDPVTQKKVLKLKRDLVSAAENADKFTIDDYNIADIAYELGSLHPDFSKAGENPSGKNADQTNQNGDNTERNNRGQTPDKIKRIEKNAQRRNSSASISGGGGSRVVSPEDVTLEDANAMSAEQRDQFKKEHPREWNKIVRG